jgi:hypothetical protein
MRVVYIASLSHSGSTLLDLMLNAHPQMVSVGELKQLGRFANFRKKNKSYRCTCGARTLWDCSFWTRVNEVTQAATGVSLGEFNVEDYDQHRTFARDNPALFAAISEVSGKEFIVDSSKSARRLALLVERSPLDVFTIFLVRDPRGQICSMLRKNKVGRQDELYSLAQKYVSTNLGIQTLVADRPHAVVRYEELVRNPERTLDGLMRRLGLAFHPAQLDWTAHERHNVGGNRMRRQSASVLRLDERWREELTPAQRAVIESETATIAGLVKTPMPETVAD